MRFAILGLAVAALTAAAIAVAPAHLYLYIGAGAAWAATVLLLPQLPRGRADKLVMVIVALAMRLPGWVNSPAHSDDMHRYLWDGRVQRAGENPYLHPPDAPELTALRDDNWALVNHRELPTIYPPLAQLLFRAAPSPAVWKGLVALADLGLMVLLMVWLPDPRRAIVWAWCPLAAVELGLNAHVDGFGILLMMAALASPRKSWAGALLGACAGIKLLGLGLLPGLRSRRATAAFVATVALLAVPFVSAGPRITGSLGEYGRRWRGNDGAFALIHRAAEIVVAHSDYRGRVELPGSRLPRLITGRDRDTIFPDEAANFAARAVAGLLLLAAAGIAFVKRVTPLQFAEVVLGGFLLLTPTLHPWYVLWVVPLVAAGASPAWLALAVLAPLGYEPLGRWLTGAPWQDPIWTRALEHGLTWVLLLAGLRGWFPTKRPLPSGDR